MRRLNWERNRDEKGRDEATEGKEKWEPRMEDRRRYGAKSVGSVGRKMVGSAHPTNTKRADAGLAAG